MYDSREVVAAAAAESATAVGAELPVGPQGAQRKRHEGESSQEKLYREGQPCPGQQVRE